MQELLVERNNFSTVVTVVEDLPARTTVNIPLKPSARRIVEQVRSDTGIPNTEFLSRLVEWFADLDRKFRLALLNRDDETRKELAKRTLEEMAEEPESEIVAERNRIFHRNGLSIGEGIARLSKLLVECPEELRPIILGQAHGNAVVALAKEVIRQHETDGMNPPKPPGKGQRK